MLFRSESTVSGGTAVSITAATRVFCIGDYWDSYGGLAIAGDIEEVTLANVTASAANWVAYSSGAVRSCILSSCQVQPSGFGVIWPAANIPSAGLLIDGCHFNRASGAIWSGFSEVTARVNVKAVSHAAGLESETPIVP